MKTNIYQKIKVVTAMLVATASIAVAQTFPYVENFDAMTDTTLPSGYYASGLSPYDLNNWIGYGASSGYPNKKIQVLPSVGTTNTKALVMRNYSTYNYPSIDSTVTPAIGLLTAGSVLEFDYSFLYTPHPFPSPATPVVAISPNYFNAAHTYGPSYSYFKIYALDLSNFSKTLIYTLDSTNHVPLIAYQHQSISLAAFTGKNIKLIFMFNKPLGGVASPAPGFDAFFNEFRMDNLSVSNGTVSVKEHNKNTFITSPNPTSGVFTIRNTDSKEMFTYTVYDMLGKTVIPTTEAQQQATVDLSALKNGVYLIKTTSVTNTNFENILLAK
ncbi:MAG: T9SS type A sorting domain-containing protein [Bacteroidia bacterium]